MITDKELLAFRDGIFKPYFEKYIEFKRGKGEKVSHSTLIRLKALNESLNRYSNTLDIELDTVETVIKGKGYRAGDITCNEGV